MRFRSIGFKAAGMALAVAMVPAAAPWAVAAESQKALPAVSAEPGATSATFGDWVLNCQRQPEGAKPARLCEVVQSIRVQGQQGPFAKIAIGRPAGDKPLAVTVVLPDNISLPSVVRITADGKDAGLDLNWTRCTPGGCFAEAPLAAEVVKDWRATTRGSKVSFKDEVGREIGFPISFRGLAQALNALEKET